MSEQQAERPGPFWLDKIAFALSLLPAYAVTVLVQLAAAQN